MKRVSRLNPPPNIEWGTDVFHPPEAIAVLRDSVVARVEDYAVHEILGVDKSEPVRRRRLARPSSPTSLPYSP